jgi:hypothetical protein
MCECEVTLTTRRSAKPVEALSNVAELAAIKAAFARSRLQACQHASTLLTLHSARCARLSDGTPCSMLG